MHMSHCHPVIFGLKGTEITPQERAFFTTMRPYGFILFARNIETPAQTKALVADLNTLIPGKKKPILIDQEGGRVARLRPPFWSATAPVASLINGQDQAICEQNIARQYRDISEDLHALGVTVNCAPVLDLRIDGCHDIVGDRAFGSTPQEVITHARVAYNTMLAHHITPIIKHIPGHGRAMADSHEDLPVVTTDLATLARTDFAPFRAFFDAPYAMTAHIIFTALDAEKPVTLSKICIDYIRTEMGFTGALMSDDLSMKALSGSMQQRAAHSLEAGCNLLLHCNGDMAEMQEIASVF